MSKLYGTIINDTIYPASTEERFPTHDALYGKGGYRSVNTIEERDAIPVERLVVGCEVRVMGEEGSPVYYVSSLNPLTWELVPNGSVDEEQVSEIVDNTLSEKSGVANGIASLDGDGKLNQSQLPDTAKGRVVQGQYIDSKNFYDELGNVVIPDKTSVYVDKATGAMYTWNGESYITETLDWIDV